jgi:hypothetical protein
MGRKASLRSRDAPLNRGAMETDAGTRRKLGLRLGRVLRSTIAWAITAAALVFCAAVHGQQKPLTVEDAIAFARPITYRDPSVHSVEIRGLFGSNQFAYFYEAPDRYKGLMAVGDPKFTSFAGAGSRVILYDPRQGELVEFGSILPGIQGRMQSDGVAFIYTFFSSEEADPSSPWQPGLHIDLPSILGNRDLTEGELQSLPGGKYRLAFTAKKWGPLVATIDPSQGFAFTDIEIGTSTSKNFVEIHVNRVPPAATPPIPSTRQLRQLIPVREVPFSMAVLGRAMACLLLTQAALAPRPVAMREGVQSPARRQAQSDFGETVNWDKVDANLKRDIPKLQQMLPLP